MIRFLLNLETFHDFRLQGRKKKNKHLFSVSDAQN